MTLKGRYALYCTKRASFGYASPENLNEDRPILPANHSTFYQYKVYADIRGSSVKEQWVVDNGNFQRFRWLFLRKL